MKKNREIATIIIGLLAVIVILVGQVNYYPVQVKAMEEISLEDETEAGENEVLKIYTNDAVSSAVQFSFHQVLHFISDIYSEAVEEVWEEVSDQLNPTEFFETLFQRIISPNAP